MTTLGQLLLLVAFVATGYSAFIGVVGGAVRHPVAVRLAAVGGWIGWFSLSAALLLLCHALWTGDERFAYVTEHTTADLPRRYAVAALWVGQSGSLMLWAWWSAVIATFYRYWPRRKPWSGRSVTAGLLHGICCFLLMVIVFFANPMEPNLGMGRAGLAMSPLLHHPVMLVHPPLVFLAYALWMVPGISALEVLATGRSRADWVREMRPWALSGWLVLGVAVFLGADWAYEELGWGGYWAWDPVENGSLLPWLTGTIMIHTALVWRHRGAFKRTTLGLAVVTMALCFLATYITRSGLVVSVHAFGRSAIGWTFLVATLAGPCLAAVLMARRWPVWAPRACITSIWSREAMVALSGLSIALLAGVTLFGTICGPISGWLVGQTVTWGESLYNRTLIPTGLVLLITTLSAPLFRWRRPPSRLAWRVLAGCVALAAIVPVFAMTFGKPHPLAALVSWLATAGVIVIPASLAVHAAECRIGAGFRIRMLHVLRKRRREYAAFVVHLGIFLLAIGLAGSALGSRRSELTLSPGRTGSWDGMEISCRALHRRSEGSVRIVEAELTFVDGKNASFVLRPAQQYHPRHELWTNEMAIHSTWTEDVCAILLGTDGDQRVDVALVSNPMMRLIWIAPALFLLGIALAQWPITAGRRRRA